MQHPAIRVNNLWKQYAVGKVQQQPGTFYELLTHGLRAPWRRLSGLQADQGRDTLFWALRDLSFEVAEGEVVGIIGRNGAGKSTLLKLLSRISAPTRGRIEMRGRLSSLLEVGTGFHPELSGRENIYLNGAILGMSKHEVVRKFDEIVSFAEVDNFIDTPVKRYSSGMYVRLAFSVAAHLEPDIFVVDEVLAVGDMQFQNKCLGKLEKVAKGGRCVLFVSHNLAAVQSLCTRAILLDQGQLIQQGRVAEVTERYISSWRRQVLSRSMSNADETLKNGTMRVLSVSIKDSASRPMSTVASDAPFLVEIEYEIVRDGASAGMTVIVYDSYNNVVFSSINNHEPNWYGKPMPAGRYRSTCRIPENFLNYGCFRLGLNIFGKGFSDAELAPEVLTFEVDDSGPLRGDYYGEFGGSVRPLLAWHTAATAAAGETIASSTQERTST